MLASNLSTVQGGGERGFAEKVSFYLFLGKNILLFFSFFLNRKIRQTKTTSQVEMHPCKKGGEGVVLIPCQEGQDQAEAGVVPGTAGGGP